MMKWSASYFKFKRNNNYYVLYYAKKVKIINESENLEGSSNR